jgi:hypothetical protein
MLRVKENQNTVTRPGTTYIASEAHQLPSGKAIKEAVVARRVLRATDARDIHLDVLLRHEAVCDGGGSGKRRRRRKNGRDTCRFPNGPC